MRCGVRPLLAFSIVFGLPIAAGCGGGGALAPGSSADGHVTVRVRWPEGVQSRLLMTACESVKVMATGPGINTPVTEVINAPAGENGDPWAAVTLSVPAGPDRVVDAQGFDAPDAGGAQIQKAYAPFTIAQLNPGATVAATLYFGDMGDTADDIAAGATPIATDGTPSAPRVSDARASDGADHFLFGAVAGQTYLISTHNVVGTGAGGYYLEVLDAAGTGLLAQGPWCPDTDEDWLVWMAPSTGDYLARLANDLNGQIEYMLSIEESGIGTSALWGYVTSPDVQPGSARGRNGGGPVAGVLVAVSDGETLYMATSRADGSYLIPGIPIGARVVSFDADGYGPMRQTVTVASVTDWVRVDGVLAASEIPCPLDPPVINVDSVQVDQDQGSARVIGSIQNVLSDTAVLVLNGSEQLVPLSGGALFDVIVILSGGDNTIVIRASNCQGNSLSLPEVAQWIATFVFRVTLMWDTATDFDLHTWGPGSLGGIQHCSYANVSIDAGELDYDNTSGFGPENFTARTLIAGRYAVAANYYSGSASTNCTVRVITPYNGITDLGPHVLSLPNYNSGYPITGSTGSWWRAADIVVQPDGTVTIEAPDGTAYPMSVPGGLPRSGALMGPTKR